MDQDTHHFSAAKDNTHLFEDRFELLTEKDGEAIWEWANSGDVVPAKPTKAPVAIVEEPTGEPTLADLIAEIDALAKALPSKGITKILIADTIKGATGGMANYNNIKDITTAEIVLTALRQLEDK